jgi:DNA invertase Pin-like site-specific DNA recombinase
MLSTFLTLVRKSDKPMATGKFVSYLRVSTERQGRSGLGLEAQRQAVADYLNGGDWELLAEFVEVESGKRNDRPQLAAALHRARVTGAMLLIAKLDRLSRDAHFLLGLERAGIEFVACDMPHANRLTVGIMALVAEQEREAISQRTKAALQAVKARGKRLGNPNGANALRAAGAGQSGWTAGAEGNKRTADEFAARVLPVIADIRAAGIGTLDGLANELNRRGILTARRGAWHPSTVKRLLARA